MIAPTGNGEQDQNVVHMKPNFEDVLEKLGGFGIFQFLALFLILFLEIPASFISFTSIFVSQNPEDTWVCDGVKINSSSDICLCNGTLVNSLGKETIIAEWKLLCGAGYISDLIVTIQMAGMFIGTLFCCKLGDWYGRRHTMLGVVVIMGLGQGLSAISPNVYFYAATRFIAGFGMSGFLGISSIYVMEFQTPKWRTLSQALSPWGEGVMLFSLIAYFVRPWRLLLISSVAPFIIVIFAYWVIPESPRWLIRQGKVEETQDALNRIANINRKTYIEKHEIEEILGCELCISNNNTKAVLSKSIEVKKYSYAELFRDSKLRWPTIYQILIMCCSSIAYYGISFNIRNMKGSSPYLVLMLLGLGDAIGYPSALIICNRLGRRMSLAVFMIFGACFLATLAILELIIGIAQFPTLTIVLCLLGKVCIAGGRTCGRTLIGELYPTGLRAMGSGLGGIGTGLGALIAPQITYVGTLRPSIPYFVFAIIGIVGAAVSLLLTETMGKSLETLEHIEEDEAESTAERRNQEAMDEIPTISDSIPFPISMGVENLKNPMRTQQRFLNYDLHQSQSQKNDKEKSFGYRLQLFYEAKI